MGKPKPIGASQIFAEAGQSQKIFHLSSRVEELEAEIVQLKERQLNSQEKIELEAKIQELTQQLLAQGGVQEIELKRMHRNILQPRQTFPKVELQAFAELLKEEGQHTPVILFPWEEDYLIFDGERRWRAAPLIPWKTLKAVIIPVETQKIDIKEIQSQALSTSIHRKDLHPLDLAECLVGQIVYRYPDLEEDNERIPTILNTCLQRLKRSQKILELTEIITASRNDQQDWLETAGLKHEAEFGILKTLLNYQLNPVSINTNVFPMLAITGDLKEAVRTTGLDASKVREINKLSAKKLNTEETIAQTLRAKTVNQVVVENLSLSETRELVNEIFKEYNPEESLTIRNTLQRTIKTLQSLSTEGWESVEIEALRQVLKDKIAELEQILNNN